MEEFLILYHFKVELHAKMAAYFGVAVRKLIWKCVAFFVG
jgi:hypothetical protein